MDPSGGVFRVGTLIFEKSSDPAFRQPFRYLEVLRIRNIIKALRITIYFREHFNCDSACTVMHENAGGDELAV